MHNTFGFSLYVSSGENQLESLKQFGGSGYYVFTSFHIEEEFNTIPDYCKKATVLCQSLYELGYKIIGDVSPKTLTFFQSESILEFANKMHLSIIRIDYGFDESSILEMARHYPICFNASTLDLTFAKRLLTVRKDVYAMHNFYPRPETGLDEAGFHTKNSELKALGIQVFAFIPGDFIKRGPIFEGLPTLEKHRQLTPYISFLDMIHQESVDGIFIGDHALSQRQSQFIQDYLHDEIIQIPVHFLPEYSKFMNQTYTIRIDSPYGLLRLQESREYSCFGEKIAPFNCIERKSGSITLDNEGYSRYSGEIQIMRNHFPFDLRVNVIGSIEEHYLPIVYCIKNGQKIRFISLN